MSEKCDTHTESFPIKEQKRFRLELPIQSFLWRSTYSLARWKDFRASGQSEGLSGWRAISMETPDIQPAETFSE